MNYSEIYSHIDYIPLESNKESQLGSITSLETTNDGSLVVFDRRNGKVVLFGKDGKFLNCIGHRGHGPNEYVSPEIVRYNPFSNQVVVYEGSEHCLLHFELDGKLKSKTVLHKYIRNFGIVDSTSFAIYANSTDEISEKDISYSIEVVDVVGKIINQFEPHDKKNNFNPPANNVFWANNDNLYYIRKYNPYVFKVTKDDVFPIYKFNYGTEQFDPQWLENCESVEEVERELSENKYSDIWMFWESENKYIMMVNYGNIALLTVVVDKHDSKKIAMGDILNNDIYGLVSASMVHIKEDKTYCVIEPESVSPLAEILNTPKKSKIFCEEYKKSRGYTITNEDIQIISQLSEMSNPIIQVCTLK